LQNNTALSVKTYSLNISVNDTSNNINSSIINIDVLSQPPAEPPTPSVGAAARISISRSVGPIDYITDTLPIEIVLAQGDGISFPILGEVHVIRILRIFDGSVELEIRSHTIRDILKEGETKQYDLNEDELDDTELTLISQDVHSVKIRIDSIVEAPPIVPVEEVPIEIEEVPEIPEEKIPAIVKRFVTPEIIGTLVTALLVVIVIFILKFTVSLME